MSMTKRKWKERTSNGLKALYIKLKIKKHGPTKSRDELM